MTNELGLGTIFEVTRLAAGWVIAAETSSNGSGLSTRKLMLTRDAGSGVDVIEVIVQQASPDSFSLPDGLPADASMPAPTLDSRKTFGEGDTIEYNSRQLLVMVDQKEGVVGILDHVPESHEVVVMGWGSTISTDTILAVYDSVQIDISAADCSQSIKVASCEVGSSVRYLIDPSRLPWHP